MYIPTHLVSSKGVNIIGNFDDVTGAYTNLSDRRVKKDFQDLHFNWDDFLSLRPLTYQFKADMTNTVYIGMIAQDVNEVYPEMVSYHEDQDIYHMDYAGFGVIAIKAVQELKKELIQKDEQLEAVMLKNQELESRLSKLESLINK